MWVCGCVGWGEGMEVPRLSEATLKKFPASGWPKLWRVGRLQNLFYILKKYYFYFFPNIFLIIKKKKRKKKTKIKTKFPVGPYILTRPLYRKQLSFKAGLIEIGCCL